jgi:hypothetical protein
LTELHVARADDDAHAAAANQSFHAVLLSDHLAHRGRAGP